MSKLTAQQRIFVAEYLKDRNATQAAKRAGYSEKTAYSQGQRLLKDVEVKELVNAKVEKLEEKALVSAAYVIEGIKEVAERCLQRKPVMEFDRDKKAMLQAIDEETGEGIWEFDSAGANKALENLGKHLKLFTDKLEISDTTQVAGRLKTARERVKGGAK